MFRLVSLSDSKGFISTHSEEAVAQEVEHNPLTGGTAVSFRRVPDTEPQNAPGGFADGA